MLPLQQIRAKNKTAERTKTAAPFGLSRPASRVTSGICTKQTRKRAFFSGDVRPLAECRPAGSSRATMSKDWAKVKDKATGEVYFYNAVTSETSWEKPAARCARPHAPIRIRRACAAALCIGLVWRG